MNKNMLTHKLVRGLHLFITAALLAVALSAPTASMQATRPINDTTIEFDNTAKNVGSHTGDVYSVAVGALGGDSQFRLPEGTETASVVSYQEDFDFTRGTEWVTSGCAAGQGLWGQTSTLPQKTSGQVTAPAYWYGTHPSALDFQPDLPPPYGPCPGLDPPCYRCLPGGYYQTEYATGDLCAYGGEQHCGNLTAPRINLYNVPPPIVLEFTNCLEIEPQPTPPGPVIIQARVEIAVNGGEFFILKTFPTDVDCTVEKIDLSDYANSIIQLRWFIIVIGTSSYATNAYGWVVDDVKVIGGFDSSADNPNPDQRLYVADTRNHRISVWKYKTDSSIVTHFQNFGQCDHGAGQFCLPEDVVVGPDGRVYVADTGNHRIQVFDKDGAYIDEFGSYGDDDGKFNSPSGLAVSGWVLKDNGAGEPSRVADFFYLYVADTLNHRLQGFKVTAPPKVGVGFGFQTTPFNYTHDGNVGSYGDADGEFNLPEGTAADPIDTPPFLAPEMYQLPIVPEQWVGHVYVADQNNHRVQYFDLTGAFGDKWGTYGDADTQFHQPQDVAVGIRLEDPIKNEGERFVDVYVADTGNHQVKHYDDTGAHQDTIGSYGDADGEFNSPNGIAVDRLPQQLSWSDYPRSVGVGGNAFTVDTGNHRIQSFDMTPFMTPTFLGQFGSYGVANTVSTTITIDSAPNPSFFGQSVTFTATVTETVSGTAVVSGTVTFRDAGTPIPGGENVPLNTSGQAIFTTSSLAAGLHSIAAEFNPDPCSCLDGSSSSPLTHQVNELGTITIVKDAIPDDPRDFDFTGDLGDFSLDDALPDDTDGITDTITFPNLVSATYNVTETVPFGWDITTIVCDDGSPTQVPTGTASIDLAPGETVTCTFTNEELDTDGDGVPDIVEGTGDRDGDGIPNNEDYDPTGYFYDETTGQIIPGGQVFVTGPGVVTIVQDGSGVFYQFTTDGTAGTYTTKLTLPRRYALSSTCLRQDPPPFDLTGGPNPTVLGNGEDGATGFLTSNDCTPYYLSLDLEPGDPFIINNNFPLRYVPPVPVGGVILPVNRLELLALRLGSGQAPWMGLVALASFAALTVALVRRHKA